MAWRVWSLAREPVSKAWTSASCPDWDAAVSGNSALHEAFVRVLESEIAVKLGATVGSAVLDIQ
eukprot:1263511-Pyramimonas_sp.AAC.1